MERLPRGFREGLRRELPAWRADGIVSPEAALALEARYALAQVGGGPSFLPVYVLGAALVGAGVVSLVAWHWDEMGRTARLALIGSAMIAAHLASLALARRGTHPNLAHALSFLGTLVFGANIALVAQIFQVSGPWYGIFGGFAAGALAAGLLLESVPTLAAAAVSAMFLWGPGYANDHAAAGIAAGYALAAAFGALAWRHRCSLLTVLAGAGAAVTLGAAAHGRSWILPPLAVAAALAALPLVAHGFDAVRLAGAARATGRIGFYLLAFALSFADTARELRFSGGMSGTFLGATLPPAIVAALLLAAGLRRTDVDPHARGEAMLIAFTVPALLAGLSLRDGFGAAVVANMALAFLALGRVVRGLSWLRRGPFWEGIAVAGVLLLSRFLEIESRLWLKGAAFIACGVGVTAAALAFERRRLARREVPHVA